MREIGATATAPLIESAIKALGKDFPWHDDEARQARLGALDQKFYAYPDDLMTLLYRYVAAHREEIGAPSGF